MKKITSFFIIGIMMFSLIGCSKKTKTVESKPYPVKTFTLKKDSCPTSLNYTGIVKADEIKKYSFKTAGKISNIYVKKGDKISKGTKIAELDKKDLNFKLEASKSQMNAAKAQYDKALNGARTEDIEKAKLGVQNAEKAYNHTSDLYKKMNKLYEIGSISKQELENLKLKLDTTQIQLNQAKQVLSEAQNGARAEDKQALLSQYNAAKTQCDATQSLLNDTTITSDIDGYVVDVINKTSEMVAAGYPVAVVRTKDQIIEAGISENDIQKVKIGTKVNVTLDNIKCEGKITEIDKLPDTKSRTYNTKIKLNKVLPEKNFYIGAIAKISIITGKENGYWIPISLVMNDGEDYVYIVENNRISRKNITIKNLYDTKILVTGLKTGDKIVSKGMKNVKPGYKVKVVK